MSLPVQQNIQKDGFRLRGTEMSRIDGFSDVVFGFALTLLAVSLEVPKNCTELHASLRGFCPFAICFSWTRNRRARQISVRKPAKLRR